MGSTTFNIGKTDNDLVKCLSGTSFQYILLLRDAYAADYWEMYPPFLVFSSHREKLANCSPRHMVNKNTGLAPPTPPARMHEYVCSISYRCLL